MVVQSGIPTQSDIPAQHFCESEVFRSITCFNSSLVTSEAGCCFQAWERTFRRLLAPWEHTFHHWLRRYLAQARTFFENFRKRPNASKRFRAHPNVSERIQEGPNRSKHVSEPTKKLKNENFTKTCRNISKNFTTTSPKLRKTSQRSRARCRCFPFVLFVFATAEEKHS